MFEWLILELFNNAFSMAQVMIRHRIEEWTRYVNWTKVKVIPASAYLHVLCFSTLSSYLDYTVSNGGTDNCRTENNLEGSTHCQIEMLSRHLRKTTKSHNSRCPSRDLNTEPPEHKSTVLPHIVNSVRLNSSGYKEFCDILIDKNYRATL